MWQKLQFIIMKSIEELLKVKIYTNIHYTGSVKGFRKMYNMPASRYKAMRHEGFIYFVPKEDLE